MQIWVLLFIHMRISAHWAGFSLYFFFFNYMYLCSLQFFANQFNLLHFLNLFSNLQVYFGLCLSLIYDKTLLSDPCAFLTLILISTCFSSSNIISHNMAFIFWAMALEQSTLFEASVWTWWLAVPLLTACTTGRLWFFWWFWLVPNLTHYLISYVNYVFSTLCELEKIVLFYGSKSLLFPTERYSEPAFFLCGTQHWNLY